MSRLLPAIVLVCVSLSGRAAHAREFRVRLLKGDERNGVWGTKEFQVHVSASGRLRYLKVGGREVLRQVAALYAFPKPPGSRRSVRLIQGVASLEGRPCLAPPKMATREVDGKRVFEFRFVVAHRKVLAARPLCDVRQRVEITPTGEIHVRYDLEWLQTLRWKTVTVILTADIRRSGIREFVAIAGDRVLIGPIRPSPAKNQRFRHWRLEQLTLKRQDDSCHLVVVERARCDLTAARGLVVQISPLGVARNGFIYKGQKAVLSYSILLPVELQ